LPLNLRLLFILKHHVKLGGCAFKILILSQFNHFHALMRVTFFRTEFGSVVSKGSMAFSQTMRYGLFCLGLRLLSVLGFSLSVVVAWLPVWG